MASGDRPDISMTPDELEDFLSSARAVVLAGLASNGWPLATLASATATPGSVRATVDADDLIVASIDEGGSVCCVLDAGISYYEIKGAVLRGRVVGLSDPGGTCCVEVAIDHVVSFDFSKLPEAPRT